MKKRRTGFTLIELLIVVAIIAILAAIAVPNFLEAQVRAKVGRVKADMRSVRTAVESYFIDHNKYPILRLYYKAGRQFNRGPVFAMIDLSTPVAYISSTNVVDPFFPPAGRDEWGDLPGYTEAQGAVGGTINYMNIRLAQQEAGVAQGGPHYVMVSYGPDNKRGPIPGVPATYLGHYCDDPIGNNLYAHAQYDATNGTRSGGDILQWP
jgi:prepilin-type N-terminal cleavage/methylation domain-containing protein